MKVMTKVLKKAPPELKFFNMTTFKIAGKKVEALRHGMAGQPGFELFGPARDGDAVLAALVKAGEEFGLRLVGGRAYSSNTLESGWIPSPMPGIYSGDERIRQVPQVAEGRLLRGQCLAGRQLLRKDDRRSLRDAVRPGLRRVREVRPRLHRPRGAGEDREQRPHRIKVTLELDDADVQQVIASQYGKGGERGKFIEFPSAVYSMYPQDKVLNKDGRQVGVSTWVGYSSNERKQLTLAYLEPEFATPGTEVTFVWGEENGGSKKPTVERHKQMQIRAIVCPVPYVASVRTNYAEGSWRETGKL